MATILTLAELCNAVYGGNAPVLADWNPIPVNFQFTDGYFGVAYVNTTTHEIGFHADQRKVAVLFIFQGLPMALWVNAGRVLEAVNRKRSSVPQSRLESGASGLWAQKSEIAQAAPRVHTGAPHRDDRKCALNPLRHGAHAGGNLSI